MVTLTGADFNGSINQLDAASDTGQRYYLDIGATAWQGTNFDDDFFHLVCQRIRQTTNTTVTLADGNIVYTAGFPSFGANQSSFGPGVTATLNWDRVNLICTNGATNGFGSTGAEGFIAGNMDNCGFIGIGTGSIWFLNLQKAAATFGFSNARFVQAVINTPRIGTPFRGFNFDGTTRPNQGGFYTMRVQGQAGTNHVVQANHVFRGTTSYPDSNVGAGTATTGSHYQFFTFTGTLWSLNNQYENTSTLNDNSLTFHRANASSNASVREGYTWNPRFFQTGTTDVITDIRLLDLPTDTYTFAATNSVANGFTAIGTTQDSVNSNGYVIQTGTGQATTNNVSQLITGALAFTGDPTDLQLQATAPVVRAKSYTHVASPVTVQPNGFSYSGGTAGTYTFDTNHDNFYLADSNLNSRAIGDAAIGDAAEIIDLDDIYPTVKRLWLEDNGADIDFPIVVNGTTLEFQQDPDLYSTGTTVNTFSNTGRFRSAATSTVTINNITGVLNDTNNVADFHNVELTGNPFTLSTTVNANSRWNIDGLTSTSTLTLDGNFEDVGIVAENTFSTLNVADNTSIALEAINDSGEGGTETIILSDRWNNVTFGSGVTISNPGTADIIIQSNEAFAAGVTGTGSNVTITPVPAPPVQDTEVVIAISTLPIGTAYVIEKVGQSITLSPSGVTTVLTQDFTLSSGTEGVALSDVVGDWIVYYSRGDRGWRCIGLTVTAETALANEPPVGPQVLTPGNFDTALYQIPDANITGRSMTMQDDLTVNGDIYPLCLVVGNGTDNQAVPAQVSAMTGAMMATVPYVLAMRADSIRRGLVVPLNGINTISHDVVRPNSNGVDTRLNSLLFTDDSINLRSFPRFAGNWQYDDSNANSPGDGTFTIGADARQQFNIDYNSLVSLLGSPADNNFRDLESQLRSALPLTGELQIFDPSSTVQGPIVSLQLATPVSFDANAGHVQTTGVISPGLLVNGTNYIIRFGDLTAVTLGSGITGTQRLNGMYNTQDNQSFSELTDPNNNPDNIFRRQVDILSAISFAGDKQVQSGGRQTVLANPSIRDVDLQPVLDGQQRIRNSIEEI